jgi:hypothetical protein
MKILQMTTLSLQTTDSPDNIRDNNYDIAKGIWWYRPKTCCRPNAYDVSIDNMLYTTLKDCRICGHEAIQWMYLSFNYLSSILG